MNDIQWREPGDESQMMIQTHSSDRVIVQTTITYRTDFAHNIETNSYGPWRLASACEDVIRFAFIGD